jgi:hypothetical protein
MQGKTTFPIIPSFQLERPCMSINYTSDPTEFAQLHFSQADMADKRRVRRVVTLAAGFASQPGNTIPQCFEGYDIQGAYDFFGNEDSTPDHVQAGHRQVAKAEMSRPGTYLMLEDTTYVCWSERIPIEGLGPVSDKKKPQGFLLQSVLAFRWPEGGGREDGSKRPALELVGLAHQEYYVRTPRPESERKRRLKIPPDRLRESMLWIRSSQAIGPAPNGVRWISVGDRGADIYEKAAESKRLNHGFRIRACHDRAIVDPRTGEKCGSLFQTVRGAAALVVFDLELRARRGMAARTANLSVSAVHVHLCSPQRKGFRQGSLPPIECSAVRVWEKNPPKGVKALEWIILCDEDVQTFAQALECALQYSCRWMIEEFHKGLKTGMGAERLQLEQARRLFAAIAILSVVCLRLLAMREDVRREPDAPAEKSRLSELELDVLRVKLNRKINTVREVALALGRLGGHMNRKADGLPGWLTMWRGTLKLSNIVEGVRLAHRVKRFD